MVLNLQHFFGVWSCPSAFLISQFPVTLLIDLFVDKKFVEKAIGRKRKCLQSDNDREYCNTEFDKYFLILHSKKE